MDVKFNSKTPFTGHLQYTGDSTKNGQLDVISQLMRHFKTFCKYFIILQKNLNSFICSPNFNYLLLKKV